MYSLTRENAKDRKKVLTLDKTESIRDLFCFFQKKCTAVAHYQASFFVTAWYHTVSFTVTHRVNRCEFPPDAVALIRCENTVPDVAFGHPI